MTTSSQKRAGCSPWAITGCGCGLVAMLGVIFVFLLLGIEFARERQDPTRNRHAFIDCQQNAKYLRSALASYEKDHGHLPKSLAELTPLYIDSTSRIHCPLEADSLGDAYEYHPDAKEPTDPVLVCDNHGQATIILQRNGLIQLPLKRK